MRFRLIFKHAACLLAALGACNATRLHGQQVLVSFNVPGPADWDEPGNWNPANIPAAVFDEVAVIGGNRSVFVASAVADSAGGIIMDSSTLEIRSGGSLLVEPGPSTPDNGNIILGQSVDTNLFVRRGGSLTARNITSGGGAGTQLVLGETGGAGTATLSVTGGTLNRNTRVVGPNVAFSSSGNLTFAAQHRLAPVITGATHSTINVTGTASLAGTVRPELSGFTPVIGNSWNLVTAGSLTSSMTLDASGLPALPRGTAFSLSSTSTTAKLDYSNLLVLSVNRSSGVVTIENAIGGAIGFDGYTITSPSGALAGTWNSLQDQALAGWDEADNSSANRRTEFKTAGATSLAAGNSVKLGALFAPTPPVAFGDAVGTDLSFQYAVPGAGTLNGIVEYVGGENNLVLTIDPATGEAAIQNQSPFFNVSIDAYTITSTSGKLLTGDAAWNSLQDQGLASWDEADNSTVNRITEFKTSGATAMNGGGAVLDLGAPINIGAGALSASDFTFQFKLNTGETKTGLVAFGPLPTANPNSGDFDDDGDVDGADFLQWQRQFGSAAVPPGSGADGNANGVVDGPDLAVWRANFGSATAAAGGGVAAVPEPAAWLLAMAGLIAVGAGRSRLALGEREGK